MKRFLIILTSSFITTSLIPIIQSMQTIITNTQEVNNTFKAIVKTLNFNFYQQGYITDGITKDSRMITLVNYKQYANSWNDFTNQYQTLKLLNFDGEAGGSGITYTNTDYQINIKDITFNTRLRVVNYIYNRYAKQQGIIEFVFVNQGGNLLIYINFFTSSSNALYHVWVSLKISDVIFI